MILNIPLAIWFGLLTIASLFTTAGLGIAAFKFRKNVFRFHKAFAFLTLTLASIHFVLAVLLWFFGVSI